MGELVDPADRESAAAGCVGSSPTKRTTLTRIIMDIETFFTEPERQGVVKQYGTPWEELSDEAKLMRGLIYRHTLSPKAIADQIIGPRNEEQFKGNGEG